MGIGVRNRLDWSIQAAASIGTPKNRMWGGKGSNIYQLIHTPGRRGQTIVGKGLAHAGMFKIWVLEWA